MSRFVILIISLLQVFSGNTDRETVVYQAVNPPIRARFIRFRPIKWHLFISMRAELYGCKGKKDDPLASLRWQNSGLDNLTSLFI